MSEANNKVLLVILDGWGLSPSDYGNAPLLAKTPVLDYVYATYPKTSLSASGLEVGLNQGEPGNSEVGHLNIGSGRVAWQNLPRVDQAIADGSFFESKPLIEAMQYVNKNDSALHLIGLVSDGGVHSHLRHLFALLKLASQKKVKRVYIHFISDGRDTAPECAAMFAKEVENLTSEIKVGTIATVIGRYYAMDRDNNWDRAGKAFDLFVENLGDKFNSAREAFDYNYKFKKSDEFIEPAVIGEGGKISDNDAIIFYNHRNDRSRQILKAFTENALKKAVPKNLCIVTMTKYLKDQKVPEIFPDIEMAGILSETLSKSEKTQFHTAETEKFAHVTYFFNAGFEKPFSGETDVIVPSKKVPTYDKYPEMSAKEVAEQVIIGIRKGLDFVVVNFANGDMVGHTGVLDAAIKACENVDIDLGKVLAEASLAGYKTIITADHGNCETMIDELTKNPNKEHTTNPVPFVFLDFEKNPFNLVETAFSKEDYMQYAVGTPIGVLADIAPSVLSNLGLKQPESMTGMDLSVAML